MSQMAGVRLCDVLPIHYQMLLNDAAGKKRTQQQLLLCFSQIMRTAVHDRLYAANLYEDLKDIMKPVDYKADEKRPLTENEKKAMKDAELSPSDRIFVDILYATGLRCGEVLALTRFDIDFVEKTINVNKSIEFDDAGHPSIKCPKSHNGYRQVPIPPQLFSSLESYVRFCMRGTQLFSMRGGKLVSKSSYRRKWDRIIKAMNEVAEQPYPGSQRTFSGTITVRRCATRSRACRSRILRRSWATARPWCCACIITLCWSARTPQGP